MTMIHDVANIFIDEFGNTALNVDKKGTFSHFVYCSVVINANDWEKAENLRKTIAKNNKLGSDLKSKNLGDKYFDRRLKILNELKDALDFTIDVLVIDKSKLEQAQGLKQKQIFYKYFQNLFVKKYNDKFESFTIWADRVGESFSKELENYIQLNTISPTLFHPDRFFFLSDDISKEKLIQLADIIAGSVGKIFCSSHGHERSQEIYNILHTRMSVEFFPYLSNANELKLSTSTKHDKEIVEITLKIAADHIEVLRQKEDFEELRLLEYLLTNFQVDSTRLVPTWEITTYLLNFFHGITDEKVRTIVRNLRYSGVFVISHPGKPGYKMANSYWDITQQFQHYLRYVLPMLKKVKILNSSIAEKTFNSINILETNDAFKELEQMLRGLK